MNVSFLSQPITLKRSFYSKYSHNLLITLSTFVLIHSICLSASFDLSGPELIPEQSTLDEFSRNPKDIIILADASGSMQGEPIVRLKSTLTEMINRLTPQDRFEIIFFESTTRSVFDQLTPITPTNTAIALEKIALLEAGGGTELKNPFLKAIQLFETTPSDRLPIIVLLTDGKATSIKFDDLPKTSRTAKMLALNLSNYPDHPPQELNFEIYMPHFASTGDSIRIWINPNRSLRQVYLQTPWNQRMDCTMDTHTEFFYVDMDVPFDLVSQEYTLELTVQDDQGNFLTRDAVVIVKQESLASFSD